ncbi:MAG: hypothetical protein KBT82_14650 [Marinobacter sp.]|uniref:hypothetical protein n=1 Tax=Marinobacter sp. TaxID=50741 RepID=UPI001B7BD9E3|nr:hypothetical protein [Marinobacter sp.]MBQ0747008.1 hypothetical protein [Marinobacter sp.]MBQ0815389.1 hypothetical protein [Marinobacter sp.]
MTPFQNIWVLLCTFGPAIYVGLVVNWWSGIIAYVAAMLLGSILGWGLVSVLPVKFLAASGYLKNLVVALIIVASGYFIGAQ